MTTGTFNRPESPAYYGANQGTQTRTNKKSAWALGLGVVGIPTAFFVFPPIVFSTLAIVLGVMGRNEARQDPARGGEQTGTTAIVLGVIGFAIAVAWVFIASSL
ncbi:MAG: DUF4190 domain-containing protein [Actinomycetota bacterium]|nr:DUF4190 domain-containing protein [Actinomycetota bacterium]